MLLEDMFPDCKDVEARNQEEQVHQSVALGVLFSDVILTDAKQSFTQAQRTESNAYPALHIICCSVSINEYC